MPLVVGVLSNLHFGFVRGPCVCVCVCVRVCGRMCVRTHVRVYGRHYLFANRHPASPTHPGSRYRFEKKKRKEKKKLVLWVVIETYDNTIPLPGQAKN